MGYWRHVRRHAWKRTRITLGVYPVAVFVASLCVSAVASFFNWYCGARTMQGLLELLSGSFWVGIAALLVGSVVFGIYLTRAPSEIHQRQRRRIHKRQQ